MTLIYHPRVSHDVAQALRYYDEAGGPALGDAFFEELTQRVEQARAQPLRFHPVSGELRRANLERFPYHFLFRLRDDTIRVLVVRHNRRHPTFGLHRK
jgi:plasmid stabilization system protein ParE